jgi:hypothetical protein
MTPPSEPARTRRSARGPAALLAGLAVVVALPVWLLVVDPERHADGGGPLASLDGDDRIGESAPSTGRAVTFGLRLCISDGSDRVVVDSVRPTAPVGSGVTFLGGRVRSLDFLKGTPDQTAIGSVEGFPPPSVAPDTMVDAVGATVTYHCEREYPTAYTELLLGFGGAAGATGGWHGVDVGYRAGWRHHVLSIRYDLLLCAHADRCLDELVP